MAPFCNLFIKRPLYVANIFYKFCRALCQIPQVTVTYFTNSTKSNLLIKSGTLWIIYSMKTSGILYQMFNNHR